MSHHNNLFVAEDSEKVGRLTDPQLFPKNSSYDSLTTFVDDGDANQDIESCKCPDDYSPRQDIPHFYQDGQCLRKTLRL